MSRIQSRPAEMEFVDVPGTSIRALRLERGRSAAGCGAATTRAMRSTPYQLSPIAEVIAWHIDSAAMVEIDQILQETIRNPIGPEFMAPPDRLAA
jgi:hypothetical protein